MRILFVLFLVSGVFSANYASTATLIRCDSKLNVSMVYNPVNNSVELIETNNPADVIVIELDTGFLKVSKQQSDEKTLFRQSSIKNYDDDPLNITIRYEITSKLGINTTSIIMSDPMCKVTEVSQISINEISEHSYINTKYRCDCLSSVYDSNHFVKVR